jgi:ABC-2 type transport system ATP-binding protein
VIELSEFSKWYSGKVLAVDKLSLSIGAGEIFGFIGPNGAGKTTTIRTLVGHLKASSGRVTLFEKDAWREGADIRHRIGYLPGDLYLYKKVSTRNLISYFDRLRGINTSANSKLLSKRFDLDLDRPIGELSKGNRQKAGLLQALSHNPDLLILDEPTTGLDPLLQQEFLDIISQFRDQGRTVFLSSHLLDEVERVADRIGLIQDGRLARIGTVDELRAEARQSIEIRFDQPVSSEEFLNLEGLSNLNIDGNTLKCVTIGSMDSLVKAAAKYTVTYIRSESQDLEELFLDMYRKIN